MVPEICNVIWALEETRSILTVDTPPTLHIVENIFQLQEVLLLLNVLLVFQIAIATLMSTVRHLQHRLEFAQILLKQDPPVYHSLTNN